MATITLMATIIRMAIIVVLTKPTTTRPIIILITVQIKISKILLQLLVLMPIKLRL